MTDVGNSNEKLSQPFTLEGKRILVTGASSGIGRGIAILVSQLGGRVVAVGRDLGRLAETSSMLHGEGHQTSAMELTQVAELPGWMVSLAGSGRLDGLVHAAGIQSTMPLQMLAPDDLQTMLRMNVEVPLMLAKAFRQRQVVNQAGGAIVWITSVMGMVGAAGRSAYSASKGALHGAVRSLALELAPQKIRINCIAPGFVKTPMLAEMSRLWSQDQRAQVERLHPLGFGEAADVAAAASFLMADSGRWVTGTVMVVDGGYSAC